MSEQENYKQPSKTKSCSNKCGDPHNMQMRVDDVIKTGLGGCGIGEDSKPGYGFEAKPHDQDAAKLPDKIVTRMKAESIRQYTWSVVQHSGSEIFDLSDVQKKLDAQGEKGRVYDLDPVFENVPPELELLAQQFRAGNQQQRQQTLNIIADLFDLVWEKGIPFQFEVQPSKIIRDLRTAKAVTPELVFCADNVTGSQLLRWFGLAFAVSREFSEFARKENVALRFQGVPRFMTKLENDKITASVYCNFGCEGIVG